jgi:hypothetical protein
MQIRPLIMLAGLVALLAACGPAEQSGTPETTESGTLAPSADDITVSAAESAVVGRVVSPSGLGTEPLPKTEVRLASVFWNDDKSEGAFVVDATSGPTAITDQNGAFAFDELRPTDYVLVVGDLFGQHVILSNPDGSAMIYTATVGQVLDVGDIEVDLASAPILTPVAVDSYPAPAATVPSPGAYP